MFLRQVTNDIFTKEDGEFLVKHGALAPERICAVQTGGCPHAAIREDISINLGPLEELSQSFKADILLCESGGGNEQQHRSPFLLYHQVLQKFEAGIDCMYQVFHGGLLHVRSLYYFEYSVVAEFDWCVCLQTIWLQISAGSWQIISSTSSMCLEGIRYLERVVPASLKPICL